MTVEMFQRQLCDDPGLRTVHAAAATVIYALGHVDEADTLARSARVRRRKSDEVVVVKEMIRELDEALVAAPVVPQKVRFLEDWNDRHAVVEQRLQRRLPHRGGAVVFFVLFGGKRRLEK